MRLIEPKAELLLQQPGLEGVYKQIELAGRTCYKSEDKITKNSAKPFVDRMINSNHLAMLEHGTVYLKDESWIGSTLKKYAHNKYSRYKDVHLKSEKIEDGYTEHKRGYYVTTNLRVLVENDWLDDLQYICEPTEYHEKRYTLRFKGDIHLYKDTTRHRPMSYAIESTRYCNYLKEKFGMSVSFMRPTWLKEEFLEEFNNDCQVLENIYFKWINKGLRAEEAAYFLCQGTAAEYCITGFTSDWKHLLDLRLFETTGKVHPDMLNIMKKAQEVMQEADIWKDIYK